jgi:hypothetical protein
MIFMTSEELISQKVRPRPFSKASQVVDNHPDQDRQDNQRDYNNSQVLNTRTRRSYDSMLSPPLLKFVSLHQLIH